MIKYFILWINCLSATRKIDIVLHRNKMKKVYFIQQAYITLSLNSKLSLKAYNQDVEAPVCKSFSIPPSSLATLDDVIFA